MTGWSEMNEIQRDLLVAEKILNIKNVQWHHEDPYSVIQHYTTDIAAAWSVVEAVGVRHETDISPPFILHRHENEGYFAEFNVQGSSGYGFGKMAPEAICKAAIRAAGIEV